MELAPRSRGRSLVSLDGEVVCGQCGNRSRIPHHLSLAFWKFWTREQLSALVQQMQPGERLAWIAHRLVQLQAADGSERSLREHDGKWCPEPTQSENPR